MAAIGAIPLWAAGIAAPVVSPAIVAAGAGVAIASVVGFAAVTIGSAAVKIAEHANISEQVWSWDKTVVSRSPAQQERSSTREKEEKKKVVVIEIEEAMKKAQIAFEIDIKVADEEQSPDRKRPPRARVGSGMRNAQPRTLKLYSFGSFSGDFVVPPPPYMFESPIFIGLFLHQGSDPDDDNSGDSKGYVIYGSEEDRPLLYILAWSKPAKGSPKVHVQAGRYDLNKLVGQLPNYLLDQLKDQIIQKLLVDDQTRQTFNEVKETCNELEGHGCSSYDPETGAEAAAHIRSVHPGSSWAVLGAKFSRREH